MPTRKRPPKEIKIDPAPYKRSLDLTQIFPLHSAGVETGRDSLREPEETGDHIEPIQYRPFDTRAFFYDDTLGDREVRSVLKHLIPKGSRALIAAPAGKGKDFSHVWITAVIPDDRILSDTRVRGPKVYPLYRQTQYGNLSLGKMRNLGYDFLRVLVKTLGVKCRYPDGMPKGAEPDEIFDYIYAILHSPQYRRRYAKELQRDFPRIPVVGSLKRFKELRSLGAELSALHLLQAPELDTPRAAYFGKGGDVVSDSPSLNGETLWINRTQGFKPVAPETWGFRVGDRQVCREWLANRRGRPLAEGERRIFCRILESLARTRKIMADIDAAVNRHGGWPIQ